MFCILVLQEILKKQLKKWKRKKKFDLIKSLNPDLKDLSEDW